MSAELERSTSCFGGDLSLSIIQKLFPDEASFCRGVHGLLNEGDVVLRGIGGQEISSWQWRELSVQNSVLKQLDVLKPSITDQGVRRIG